MAPSAFGGILLFQPACLYPSGHPNSYSAGAFNSSLSKPFSEAPKILRVVAKRKVKISLPASPTRLWDRSADIYYIEAILINVLHRYLYGRILVVDPVSAFGYQMLFLHHPGAQWILRVC